MDALLGDLSLFQYDDPVGGNDRGKAVGDDDNGLFFDQFLDGQLHLIFVFGIGESRRFIQYQDR